MELGELDQDSAGASGSGSGSSSTKADRVTIRIVAELPEGSAPPGLFDRVRESRNWARTLVITEFPQANQRLGHPVRHDGTVTFVPPAPEGTIRTVMSESLDLRGTIWTIRDTNGDIVEQPLRVRAGQTTELKISSRARLSVNTTSGAMVLNSDFGNMKGQFDDLTILDTVSNTTFKDGTLDIQLDPTANTGAARTETDKQAFYQQIIDRCHAAKIQALVGMHHAGNTISAIAKEFHKWMQHVAGLDAAGREGAVNKLATTLVSKTFGSSGWFPDADGICFDIEHVPAQNVVAIPDQADIFGRFYRAVAQQLHVMSKVVVVAVGEFGAASGERSLEQLDQAFNSSFSMTFTRSHPYSMAKGVPNMILRPMAFGRLNGANSGTQQMKWYREIVEYALDFHGLHPRQFQLIYEMGSGDGQVSTFNTGLLKRLCQEVARANRIGLAPFAHGAESWSQYATIDAALNPGEKPPGTRGQPVQFPRWDISPSP